MKNYLSPIYFFIVIFLMGANSLTAQSRLDSLLPVRGFCIDAPRPAGLDSFIRFIDAELAPRKVNTLIVQIDYHYQFSTHPELTDSFALSKADVGRIVSVCRKNNIRVIPLLDLLGHQSWANRTGKLLQVYPQFDETPWISMPEKYVWPNPEKLYCKSYCPLHPDLHGILFSVIDELCDAFESNTFHAGMDEVFLLGSEQSPATKGQDPAALFARAVNELHKHLVRQRKVEMLMWGDRLINGQKYEMGEWEASKNGTAAAVDMIPKDIIVCPWHYEVKESYPSIPMLLEKGFRVLPAGWKNVDASKALIAYSQKNGGPKLLGHMFTTWGVKKEELMQFPPLVEGLELLRN